MAILASVLAVAGCTSNPPAGSMPEIATIPSERVFTGEETCASLMSLFTRAHNDDLIFSRDAADAHANKESRAFFTLGLSGLVLDAKVEAAGRARGDKIALRDEMVRRGCVPTPPAASPV